MRCTFRPDPPDRTMNKRDLSERDICTKFITPALSHAGWEHKAELPKALIR